MKKKIPFYQLTVEQALNRLHSDSAQGLSEEDVAARQKKYGKNILPDTQKRSLWLIFFQQFKNPLIYVLVAAAVLIYFFGEHALDAFVISGILLFNATIGTIQEWRAQKTLAALKKFVKTETVVLRNGERQLVAAQELVPGDIIIVQEGQRIPADARLIEANSIQIDEASLTGESQSISKIDTQLDEELSLADQRNMIFKGTFLVAGSGTAVVVRTGTATEIGDIAQSVVGVDTAMPIRRELQRISRWILVAIFIFCVILFFVGLATGKPLQELLVMLAALFICVIPEGLPVVLTLALVSGVYRMAKKGALVKQMQAIEGLGRVDVIAVDKTGTLTRNEMVVSHVAYDEQECQVTGEGYHAEGELLCRGASVDTVSTGSPLEKLLVACSLLDTTQIIHKQEEGTFEVRGDPTEAAMGVFARKLGYEQDVLKKEYHKLYEIPFTSQLGYHAGFYAYNGKGVAFIAGSLEELERRSVPNFSFIKQHAEQFVTKGLRVIALAQKEFDQTIFSRGISEEQKRIHAEEIIKNSLHMQGVVGIEDAIRPEVHEVIQVTRDAGIRVIMVTGDHKETALYVAQKVGIFHEGDVVVDGREFDQLSDDALRNKLDVITVYSRVTPDEKLKIVNLFHDQGKLIAMTGDGVNDVPSLVAADLGLAMGGIGTEVAKEAADIVLLKDSFSTIIEAIKESRHIFYTLRRIVLYFFSTNMAEVLIVFFALITQMPLPLTAVQILWLNFVTDGFLDAGLVPEPQEKGLLKKSWLARSLRLVDLPMVGKMLYMAVPMALGSLGIFWYYYPYDVRLARSLTLLSMAMYQWFNAWNCRSEDRSIFQQGIASNMWLIAATSTVLVLQLILFYVPSMQTVFGTVAPTGYQWALVLSVTLPIILLEEIRKYSVRHYFRAA